MIQEELPSGARQVQGATVEPGRIRCLGRQATRTASHRGSMRSSWARGKTVSAGVGSATGLRLAARTRHLMPEAARTFSLINARAHARAKNRQFSSVFANRSRKEFEGCATRKSLL
jgi:hypothetical protein